MEALVVGVVVIVAFNLIYMAIKAFLNAASSYADPLQGLKRRLVSGEISEDEYLRIKRLLTESSAYSEKVKNIETVRLSDDGELVNDLDGSREHLRIQAR